MKSCCALQESDLMHAALGSSKCDLCDDCLALASKLMWGNKLIVDVDIASLSSIPSFNHQQEKQLHIRKDANSPGVTYLMTEKDLIEGSDHLYDNGADLYISFYMSGRICVFNTERKCWDTIAYNWGYSFA